MENPILTETYNALNKAIQEGFGWPDNLAALAKVQEELDEVREALL